MTQQEQALNDSWKMLRLEQEKEKIRQEYLERIADINLEILQLQTRTSHTTTHEPPISLSHLYDPQYESPVLPEGDKIVSVKDKFFRTLPDAGKETTK